MAVVKPLYNSSNNLQQMTTTQVNEIVDQVIYQYSLNPTVVLSVVGSSGNLGAISDTRLQAGSQSTSVSSFPGEGTTAEPSVVTVNYSKITSTKTSITPTADSGKTWPIYYTDTGEIRAMSLQDVLDTFIHPAIDLLTSANTTTQQAGTYHISTSTSVTGSTEVSGSSTAVFTDTRANASAYTASGIPETSDQPTTIQNYYLHRINGVDNTFTNPLFIDGSNDIKEFVEGTFESLLQEWIRYTAADSPNNHTITYNFNGSGNNRGSGMGDTRLNGSGNYQTRFVNANDYRAQEFPNGSATTVNTHYLKINKV